MSIAFDDTRGVAMRIGLIQQRGAGVVGSGDEDNVLAPADPLRNLVAVTDEGGRVALADVTDGLEGYFSGCDGYLGDLQKSGP